MVLRLEHRVEQASGLRVLSLAGPRVPAVTGRPTYELAIACSVAPASRRDESPEGFAGCETPAADQNALKTDAADSPSRPSPHRDWARSLRKGSASLGQGEKRFSQQTVGAHSDALRNLVKARNDGRLRAIGARSRTQTGACAGFRSKRLQNGRYVSQSLKSMSGSCANCFFSTGKISKVDH